jgi:2-haloacid dehalogenase
MHDDLRRQVRALTFDIFGTVVDWRSSIVAEGEALGARLGVEVDWARFAEDWRAGYQPAMARVRRRELPWTTIDGLHRLILDGLLEARGLRWPEHEVARLNTVWHRLRPWPDSVPGLHALKPHLTLATLSNGNLSLLVAMAKQAGLPWDCVLSAELFHHYKPDPQVYLGAVRLLGLEPAEVMMVAAHPSDLRAARACGLRTAYIPRPLEHGEGGPMEPHEPGEFDLTVPGILHLAEALVAPGAAGGSAPRAGPHG